MSPRAIASGGGVQIGFPEATVDESTSPVGIRRIRCVHATHVHLSDDGTHYTVAIPVSGAAEVSHRAAAVDADPGRAVVCRPECDIDMSCGEDFCCYAIAIDTSELTDVLEHRLGRPVHRPLEFAASLDLRTPAGRARAELARLLVSSPVLRHPLLSAAAQETLMAGLLLALDHPYRDELDAPVHSWGPGPVRRMVEVIEASPRHAFTMRELSDVAGVSVPVLRECCRRHGDISPSEHLRAVRLIRAHRELGQADAGWTSAARVASTWGFLNQGRFDADYEDRYGLPPWLTLRGAAYA